MQDLGLLSKLLEVQYLVHLCMKLSIWEDRRQLPLHSIHRLMDSRLQIRLLEALHLRHKKAPQLLLPKLPHCKTLFRYLQARQNLDLAPAHLPVLTFSAGGCQRTLFSTTSLHQPHSRQRT